MRYHTQANHKLRSRISKLTMPLKLNSVHAFQTATDGTMYLVINTKPQVEDTPGGTMQFNPRLPQEMVDKHMPLVLTLCTYNTQERFSFFFFSKRQLCKFLPSIKEKSIEP